MSASTVQTPYGGPLVNLLASESRIAELRSESMSWRSWDLTARQLCDLELLLTGGFSPLRGFLGREDYESVCDSMRLTDGTLWPIPVMLDLPQTLTSCLEPGEPLALRDPEGVMVAVVRVEEIFKPNRRREAESVYRTTRHAHPGVNELLFQTHENYVAGPLEGLQQPTHYDFTGLRLTPTEVRAEFERRGWSRVVAFQTRNPMHRAHQELTLRAAAEVEGHVLLHPVVGRTKPGDVDHYTRIRCYRALLEHYRPDTAMLALLPLAMRMAGPREALWHAIIRRNHGATHLIVGRDHAGPGADSAGAAFYGEYDAQQLVERHQDELGVGVMPFHTMVYAPGRSAYVTEEDTAEEETLSVSGTDLRERLEFGRELPGWFTYPEVARELRRSCAPRRKQGFTVFMSGLSGSGKSTVANALIARILELGDRQATLLDGDLVRKHLSSELGFSKEHRDLNVRRIGWVASEITKNGGIAICAPIAPYRLLREEVRSMIEPVGGFLLVHVATPLEVCEARDRKGLYAKARAGMIPHFTGISDPYEAPVDAEVSVDTTHTTAAEAAQIILERLAAEGYLPAML
ncbi:bifunctional sulfate adenylyltransferase/adenylylsulfate kinase [soil metagenome]